MPKKNPCGIHTREARMKAFERGLAEGNWDRMPQLDPAVISQNKRDAASKKFRESNGGPSDLMGVRA